MPEAVRVSDLKLTKNSQKLVRALESRFINELRI